MKTDDELTWKDVAKLVLLELAPAGAMVVLGLLCWWAFAVFLRR